MQHIDVSKIDVQKLRRTTSDAEFRKELYNQLFYQYLEKETKDGKTN